MSLFINESDSSRVANVDNDLDLTRAMTTERTKRWVAAPAQSRTIYIQSKDLQCYNKKTKKCDGLTESLWTSLCLSAMSINKKLSNFGCSTCSNIRGFGNSKVLNNLDVCNCYSAITVKTKAREDATIEEIGRELRNDFKKKYNDESLFAYLKALGGNIPVLGLKGVGTEITNVGPIPIKKPVVDCHLGILMNSDFTESVISLMGSSVISSEKNEIALRLRYGPNKVSEEEATKIAKRIVHLMKNVPKETRIDEALHSIQNI